MFCLSPVSIFIPDDADAGHNIFGAAVSPLTPPPVPSGPFDSNESSGLPAFAHVAIRVLPSEMTATLRKVGLVQAKFSLIAGIGL